MLGRLLRECREVRGMSQHQLARSLGRTQAFVWKVESGYQHVDLATLFDIARLLDASPIELVDQVWREANAAQPNP